MSLQSNRITVWFSNRIGLITSVCDWVFQLSSDRFVTEQRTPTGSMGIPHDMQLTWYSFPSTILSPKALVVSLISQQLIDTNIRDSTYSIGLHSLHELNTYWSCRIWVTSTSMLWLKEWLNSFQHYHKLNANISIFLVHFVGTKIKLLSDTRLLVFSGSYKPTADP